MNKIVTFLDNNKKEFSKKVVKKQLEINKRLNERYTPSDIKKCERDVEYLLAYFIESFQVDEKTLFEDYLLWAKRLLKKLNIHEKVVIENIEIIIQLLKEKFDIIVENKAISFLRSGIEKIKSSDYKNKSYLSEKNKYSDLAKKYLNFLIEGKKSKANKLIMDTFKTGVSIKDIYLNIFQPVQYEVGRLWHENIITVAQEHYATAITQLIMSRLYPYIIKNINLNYKILAGCVGDELHEMGIRMLADFFEMEGWDTYYIGANTPADSIIQNLKYNRIDVLALSVLMTFHIKKAKTLIKKIREEEDLDNLKILVGGYPFKIADGLWEKIGADGFGRDADEAITITRRFLEN